MGSGVSVRGQTAARYTRHVGRTPLRIVSALLMSIVLSVPVLGAVCSMLCEPSAEMRAHRAHAAGVHQAAADSQSRGHHHTPSPSKASSDDTTAAQHHHVSTAAAVSDAPRPSAEWNGRCCDQPTLTLAAVPIVRHELQIDTAVVDAASIVLNGSDVRPPDSWCDASPALSLPSRSNPVLRI